MNKIRLILLMMFGLLLTSCAGDGTLTDLVDEAGESEENADRQYLAVNIFSAGNGTRADIGYQDGTQAENQVSSVRFYFFTVNGMPARISDEPSADGTQSFKSYYDWRPTGQSLTPDNNNAEKLLQTEITITNGGDTDKFPSTVIAVLNPTGLPDGNLSVGELKGILGKYDEPALTTSGNFVMSNSVYVNSEGNKMEEIPITDFLARDEEEARSNPLDIYVERAVAKLSIQIDMNPVGNVDHVYDTGIPYEIEDAAEENPSYTGNICVKFLGWNLTSTPDRSYLLKKIDEHWGANLFGNKDVSWNVAARNRSLWAINPDDVSFSYGNFGLALPSWLNPDYLPYESSGNVANAKTFGEGRKATSVYLQENAARAGGEGFCQPFNNTKVIIAAQLVEEDGRTPIILAEWGFDYYTLKGLKTKIANESNIYKKSLVGTSQRYVKIKPEDITFVTGTANNPDIANSEDKGRYYVYPRLLRQDNVSWAIGDDEDTEETTYEVANAEIVRNGEMKIWNNGYTYYYFDINHLGASGFPGYYGIVRNHIYDTRVTAIKSLGTPVYDPNETIYPEKPDDENSRLEVLIRVLNWRIVRKDFKLQW